ncbi:MAG: hypothetical protein Ct9H300mP19_04500 [Dehalococcoidia bacterium]|nr:MAG: hypothetical protein Ct9H300mP19_04500 [Dehalococcoidia bacterium]
MLCTTIIESGIDLPNVNTLIVDVRNVWFSQLFQLRGRIGRGTNRAYAYLMVPRAKQLTDRPNNVSTRFSLQLNWVRVSRLPCAI